MFEIHLGIPEMEDLWSDLEKKHRDGFATRYIFPDSPLWPEGLGIISGK